jgi:membrane fusion protein, copper/silver efflux system
MKENWKNRTALSLVLMILLLTSACNKNHDHDHTDAYTCPMHPTVNSDRPGTCPVCGMALVKKTRPGEEVQVTEDLTQLLKAPNESVVASVATTKGIYKTMPVVLEAQGVVMYDTRNIRTIPSRMNGRLEKVLLKYAFQEVTKGQKVAEIYSPEILTAQRELLYLIEHDSQNESLITSAREKLSLLGASERQINALIKRKEPLATFSIYSPYNGYVLADGPASFAAPAMSTQNAPTRNDRMTDGMGGNAASSGVTPLSKNSQAGTLIREGSYVSSGQTLFRIVNESSLRVELNVPSNLAGAVEKGFTMTLDFGNDKIQNGTVDFVQPYFNEGQEFLIVRVYTRDTKDLHIGHLVTARIESKPVEALWVPRQTVLDLGVDEVVFVKEKNVLIPRKITTGAHAGEMIEIKRGLTSSEEIAADAQYLVDSESFIKTKK